MRHAGPAGTITVHNARCVHGSRPNDSNVSRPLLLNTFAAASARMLPFGAKTCVPSPRTRAFVSLLVVRRSRLPSTHCRTIFCFQCIQLWMFYDLICYHAVGTNSLHHKSVRGNPVIRGEVRPPQLDERVRNGPAPWAPNFATGYTPPFFAPDDESKD